MTNMENIDKVLDEQFRNQECGGGFGVAQLKQAIKQWALEMVGEDYEEEMYRGPDSAPDFDDKAIIANEEKKRIRERINK